MEGGGDIAPRQRDEEALRRDELCRAGLVTRGHRHNLAVDALGAPHCEPLDHGLRCARAQAAKAPDGKFKVGGVGQARLQHRGHTVGWDHVETHAGHGDDAGRLGLVGAVEDRLKDGHLAGDVEVVGARLEAGLEEGARGCREGASDEESCVDACEARDDRRMVLEPEDAPRQAEPFRERAHLVFASACKHRALSQRNRTLSREHTRVSRGSINHPLLGFLRHRFGSV